MPSLPPAFADPAVAQAFAAFPEPVRPHLRSLRALIFELAAEDPRVGRVKETLKWGQPAYLTPDTRSGTTIRLGVPKVGGYALFTHCRTRVIPEFGALFPDLRTEGTRAVLFAPDEPPPLAPMRLLIHRALTYHRSAAAPSA